MREEIYWRSICSPFRGLVNFKNFNWTLRGVQPQTVSEKNKMLVADKFTSEVKEELEKLARKYNFAPVCFYPYYESGRSISNSLARSFSNGQLNVGPFFLDFAGEICYNVHPELLRKSADSLFLHERIHHEPPFNGQEVDDLEIDRVASLRYGNPGEYLALNILMQEYSTLNILKSDELFQGVSKRVLDYAWVDDGERMKILKKMSEKKFYRKKSLIN